MTGGEAAAEEDYVAGRPEFAGTPLMAVLTGCSGSGKSTMLAELARRGFGVQPEAGRQIVREQMAIGGRALPWIDPAAFVELAVSRAMGQFNTARPTCRPVIFDRSVIDLVSYLEYRGMPVPEHLERAVALYRYAPRVLVTPPWREIYADDGERQKTFEDAVGEYEVLVRWYEREGYDLIEVPRMGLRKRADFCERWLVGGIEKR